MLAQMCMHCYILGLVLNTLCEFLQRKEDLEESEVFNQLQWNCVWTAWIVLWKTEVLYLFISEIL